MTTHNDVNIALHYYEKTKQFCTMLENELKYAKTYFDCNKDDDGLYISLVEISHFEDFLDAFRDVKNEILGCTIGIKIPYPFTKREINRILETIKGKSINHGCFYGYYFYNLYFKYYCWIEELNVDNDLCNKAYTTFKNYIKERLNYLFKFEDDMILVKKEEI